MFNAENAPERGFRGIVRRYGMTAVMYIANDYAVSYIIVALFSAIISVIPGAGGLLDTGNEAGYLTVFLLNEICVYGVPLAVCFFIFRGKSEPVTEPPYKRFFGETLLLYMAGWFFATVGAKATQYTSEFLGAVFGVPGTKNAFSSLMPKTAFEFAVFVGCTCIIAPVCEELIYRRILLDPMRKYSDSAAAIVTSLLFGLSHFNLDQFLYTFAFGYFLAVIAIRSRSVVPCIICHIVNNLLAGIEVYLPGTLGDEAADRVFHGLFDALSAASPYILIASVPITAAALLMKLPVLHDHEGLSVWKRVKAVFSEPMLLIPVILMLIISFVKLYQ